MWWTSAGERVLRGAEWELFREGLSCLWDDVERAEEEEDGPGTTGIGVFDDLPKAERLALLSTVAKGGTGNSCRIIAENAAEPSATAHRQGLIHDDPRTPHQHERYYNW
jgi:hypothetical protein